MRGNELTDLWLDKSSQLMPTSVPVGKTRSLSRVVQGDPKRLFSEGVRYVELDYLCHNNHSLFFHTRLRLCPRLAAGLPHYMETGSLSCALRHVCRRIAK